MPWELNIHTLDIGQGDSSLIIARNTTPPVQTRAMIIDGGHTKYARLIHQYVLAQGLTAIEHLVLTNYDADHSEGIVGLMIADNLYRVCDEIAQAAAAQALAVPAAHLTRQNQIAAGAAAAYTVASGGYAGPPGGAGPGGLPFLSAVSTHYGLGAIADLNAVDVGINEAVDIVDSAGVLNPTLIFNYSLRQDIARRAGISAADAILAGANVVDAVRTSVFNRLSRTIPAELRFQTGGMYRNVHVIDIGNTYPPDNYDDVIDGYFLMSNNYGIFAPGINRVRTSNPALSTEILWNSGPTAVPAPANAPAVYVMASRKYVWNAPAHTVPIASGQPDNDDSLGLILRFNRFFFYTGGDLPEEAEDLIADAVMNNGLPNPAGPAFPAAARIACFKCGHHGAAGSTGLHFLATGMPKCAMISAGQHGTYQHPTNAVLNRLQNDPNIELYYLTNCKYASPAVPASNGLDQLMVPGNKSRVSGDNADNNTQAGRNRGNIVLSINEAESVSPHVMGPLPLGQVLRRFHITYFEDDAAHHNFITDDFVF